MVEIPWRFEPSRPHLSAIPSDEVHVVTWQFGNVNPEGALCWLGCSCALLHDLPSFFGFAAYSTPAVQLSSRVSRASKKSPGFFAWSRIVIYRSVA